MPPADHPTTVDLLKLMPNASLETCTTIHIAQYILHMASGVPIGLNLGRKPNSGGQCPIVSESSGDPQNI